MAQTVQRWWNIDGKSYLKILPCGGTIQEMREIPKPWTLGIRQWDMIFGLTTNIIGCNRPRNIIGLAGVKRLSRCAVDRGSILYRAVIQILPQGGKAEATNTILIFRNLGFRIPWRQCGLWIEKRKTSSPKEAFVWKSLSLIRESCHFYSTGTAGNTVHKLLPHLSEVKELHTHVMEGGHNKLQLFEKNTLMAMYVKCGSMVDARRLFENMPRHNVVSWNMMILGYAKQEAGVVALELYARMYQEGVRPSDRTFVAALKACSSLAALEEGRDVDSLFLKVSCLEKGRAIHSQALHFSFESNMFVGSILVDMYAKCGSMEDARHVFDQLHHRDVVSWNTMILGYAQKEEGELALELYVQMQQQGLIPDNRTLVGALKACGSLAAVEESTDVDGKSVKIGCLEKGRTIHSQVVKSVHESDVFVGTTLVDMYAKCGIMEDARHVFDELPQRDVMSWTAMILGYAQKEEASQALALYAQMHQEGVMPDDRTFIGAMKACSSLSALEEGKQVNGKFVKIESLEKGRVIHAQALKSVFGLDILVRTAAVHMYAKCGSMEDARHVFDELPPSNVVSWTAIIWGYAEQDENEEAFKLYAQMQEQGLSANSFTYVSILKACGNTAALQPGKELHTQICRVALDTTPILATSIIDMYAKCGSMVDAQHLFDALPKRDLITWNTLISGYARQGESKHVFFLFEKMKQECVQPSGVTYLSVLTLCSHAGLVDKGQKYFQDMNKQSGIMPTIEHYTCMIDLLGRKGLLDEAVAMLEKMPFQPNVVSWHAVLAACRKWKNVVIGKRAFEHAVRLDAKNAAAYVLMSNIYARAQMWEDRDRIQAMRINCQAWKKPGKSWWTDIGGKVHTFVAADRRHTQIEYIYAKLNELSIKMEAEGYAPHLDSVLWDISDDEKEDALCGHSEKLAIACALINTPEGTPIRVVKNLRVCDDCHKAIAFISKIEHRIIICRDASRFHTYKDGKCSCGDYW